MAEDGEDKLISVARHITKTIGRTNTMTDDIIQIFSTFDRRFSPEKLTQHIDNDGSSIGRRFHSLNLKISDYIDCPGSIWSESCASEFFLKAVDDLIAIRRDLENVSPSNQRLIDEADDLLTKSMFRLEDEFSSLILLESCAGSAGASDDEETIPVACPFTYFGAMIDAERIPIASPVASDSLSQGTISDLYQIARRMVAGGFGKICAIAYSRARLESLEESLSRLGVHPWTIEELQNKPWPELDGEIKRWMPAVKAAFRILFPSERRLCRRVFSDLAPVADLSFFELCRDHALQLMVLPRAVAEVSRTPERLFRVVDVYETLADLMADIELLFSDQQCSSVRSESATVCAGLRIAIRGIFAELENLIRLDPAKEPFPGGGVHLITRYVMNYLHAALGSWNTLAEVMEDDGETDIVRPCSSLKVQIEWIMDILLRNLDAKSKAYRDKSQGCIFLMNNGQYVIQKVMNTELEQIMGGDWIRRKRAAVQKLHINYQRNTWGNLIGLLQLEGGEGVGVRHAAKAKSMKEKLRRFNVCFEEIWKTQRGWTVVDDQMKEEICIAAAACVLPAYRNFLGKWSVVASEAGKQAEKSVKYSVEAVEGRIDEFFQGR